MSKFYRELRAPRLSKEARAMFLPGANLQGVPNRSVVRAGYCPGCKHRLENCQCDDERNELDFEREAS